MPIAATKNDSNLETIVSRLIAIDSVLGQCDSYWNAADSVFLNSDSGTRDVTINRSLNKQYGDGAAIHFNRGGHLFNSESIGDRSEHFELAPTQIADY